MTAGSLRLWVSPVDDQTRRENEVMVGLLQQQHLVEHAASAVGRKVCGLRNVCGLATALDGGCDCWTAARVAVESLGIEHIGFDVYPAHRGDEADYPVYRIRASEQG